MLDCPPASAADDTAYVNVVEEFVAALPGAPTRGAVISSLPESLSARPRASGASPPASCPLQGQREALEALDLAGAVGETWARRRAGGAAPTAHARPRWRMPWPSTTARARSPAFGVPVPRSAVVAAQDAAAKLRPRSAFRS